MLAFVNADAPAGALAELEHYADVIPFRTRGITYPTLSNHADLFLFSAGEKTVVAPNIPPLYRRLLPDAIVGKTPVDASLASVSAYNIASNGLLSIANTQRTDPAVEQIVRNTAIVHTRQGLCRCSALVLDNNSVVTSDGGIHKELLKEGYPSLLVSQKEIVLEGERNGCFGGCCGVLGDRVFLMGSLRHHPQGDEIAKWIKADNKTVIELFDGPLTDVGSIIFADALPC